MSLRSEFIICIVACIFGALSGCEQELDVPPAPAAPNAAEWARGFQNPLGTLTEERQGDLIEWTLGSGGVGALVGLLVGDLLLTQWLLPFGGSDSSSAEGQETSDQSSMITEGLRVDGWAQLDLPCSSGEVRLNLLLSQSGISPVIWGDLSECAYPDLGLFMDVSITVFVPGLYTPIFSVEGWGADDPQGMWLWLQGDVEYQGATFSVDTALEISTTDTRTATLYEADGARFILLLNEALSAEVLNGDLDEIISTLAFGLETGDATWSCSVESGTCLEMQ